MAHMMLAVIGDPQGFEAVSAASRALAMVTLALASLHPPLAILWSTSLALLRASSVSNEISSLKQGQPPLGLWIALSPWVQRIPNEPDKIGVFTIGLRGFIEKEVEMVPRTEALGPVVQRVLNFAGYLLMKGPVVKDGDTIGYNATEHLKIAFANDRNGTLMRVMTEEVQ